MRTNYKTYLFRMLAIVFGGFVGFYLGLFFIAQVVRFTISSILGWGDSGPPWVNSLISIVTGLSILIFSYIFLSETNKILSRTKKKRVSP